MHKIICRSSNMTNYKMQRIIDKEIEKKGFKYSKEDLDHGKSWSIGEEDFIQFYFLDGTKPPKDLCSTYEEKKICISFSDSLKELIYRIINNAKNIYKIESDSSTLQCFNNEKGKPIQKVVSNTEVEKKGLFRLMDASCLHQENETEESCNVVGDELIAPQALLNSMNKEWVDSSAKLEQDTLFYLLGDPNTSEENESEELLKLIEAQRVAFSFFDVNNREKLVEESSSDAKLKKKDLFRLMDASCLHQENETEESCNVVGDELIAPQALLNSMSKETPLELVDSSAKLEQDTLFYLLGDPNTSEENESEELLKLIEAQRVAFSFFDVNNREKLVEESSSDAKLKKNDLFRLMDTNCLHQENETEGYCNVVGDDESITTQDLFNSINKEKPDQESLSALYNENGIEKYLS